MPGLIVWKNQELNKLKRDMDRLFSRIWEDFDFPLFAGSPMEISYIDLSETEEALIVSAEIHGINPLDLHISITNDILTIKGEIIQDKPVKEGGHDGRVIRQGFFSRTIQLPCKVKTDDIEASYQNGVLQMMMPKCAPDEVKKIKIRIK